MGKIAFVLPSYPRSGSTMVRQLLQHHFGIGSASVYNERTSGLSRLFWFLNPLRKAKTLAIKTHEAEPPKNMKQLPAMLIVRDGRDAMVSYAHYRIAFEGALPEYEKCLRDLIVSPRWSVFHKAWLVRSGVAVVRYEDLLLLPRVTLLKALGEIGQPTATRTTEPMRMGFDEQHKITPDFFRRGIAGAWNDEMPEDLHDLFWEHHGEVMTLLGYGR